jgi:hypothetical protein
MTRLDPPWFLGTNTELYTVKTRKERQEWEKIATTTLVELLSEKRDEETTESAIRGLLILKQILD